MDAAEVVLKETAREPSVEKVVVSVISGVIEDVAREPSVEKVVVSVDTASLRSWGAIVGSAREDATSGAPAYQAYTPPGGYRNSETSS